MLKFFKNLQLLNNIQVQKVHVILHIGCFCLYDVFMMKVANVFGFLCYIIQLMMFILKINVCVIIVTFKKWSMMNKVWSNTISIGFMFCKHQLITPKHQVWLLACIQHHMWRDCFSLFHLVNPQQVSCHHFICEVIFVLMITIP